jgi:hypothetical protein
MTFLLDPRNDVLDELRRVARHETEAALAQLDRPDEDVHEVVHEVRKHGKKIRGLLRLVRPALGDQYRPANDFVRDAGGRLSEIRDATSLLECVDDMAVLVEGEPGSEHLPALRSELLERRERTIEALDQGARLERFGSDMRELLERIARWELSTGAYEAVGPGFTRSYSAGRKAMREAYDAPSFDTTSSSWPRPGPRSSPPAGPRSSASPTSSGTPRTWPSSTMPWETSPT